MTSDKLPREVIILSTADWDSPFWTNKQHLASRLAQRGFRVLYVESTGLRRPTIHRRDLHRMGRRLARGLGHPRQVMDNLWVCSPLAIPFHTSSVCRLVNERVVRTYLLLFAKMLGFSRPIVWTYNPLSAALASSLRRSLLVYHCVDNLAAAPRLPSAAIRSAETTLLRSADVVFTTSPELQAHCSAQAAGRTHYFPNVADFEHFSRARDDGPIPDDLLAIPGPRLGFIGAISNYKVDFALMAEVARLRPAWHWVLIGQVGEGQPDTRTDVLQADNIHLLGPRSYQQLPDYLRGIDVAVIPAPLNDYTRAMFPMKFFEYLAAGKPVVASRLPALQEFAEVCVLAGSVNEYIVAIERVLAGGAPSTDRGIALARQHTWDTLLDAMFEHIEQRI